MKNRKIKILVLLFLFIIILAGLIFMVYLTMNYFNIDSQFVSGLLGAIIGGIFSLLSVWIANEIQDMKREYNDMPKKIRRLSNLRDKIWSLKEMVGQDINQIKEVIEDILDISSQIDGKIYSICINIRDLSLEYIYKNFNNRQYDHNDNDIGVLNKNEYIKVKQELYQSLISTYESLLNLEEKLTREFY